MGLAMAESHAAFRRLSRLAVFCALLCVAMLTAGPAIGSASAQFRAAAKGPLPVPGAFRLAASNGYILYMVGIPPRGDRSGALLISASAKGKGVTYKIPAVVTETSIQSDLGELGEISVTFHRSNHATTVPCGERAIRFDSGNYEGTIDFHGEEGYTTAEATTVPGNIDYWISGFCGGSSSEGFSGRSRGAALYVRNPALGPEMSISNRRPGAATQIAASMSEYSNGTSIERFTSLWMPGGGFTYDRHLRTATVRPPAPFTGSARFDLRKKAGQRWSGDLTVDLPGRADVPLTGASLRAALVPAG
ncbi:MAG TPA: hypothetical protein VGO66_11310 [Solirubrobacterales bacterium]|jgi:hypothetical protein|nr:hypothetical protein [Solirubrobacterales bacterium]